MPIAGGRPSTGSRGAKDMDNGWESRLLDAWSSPPCGFYVLVFILSLGVRAVVCLSRAWQISFRSPPERHFGRIFWQNFKGQVRQNPDESDYLLPFFVGTAELLAFPYLMRLQAWSVLGAWIGFKTLAQFEEWKTSRNAFNRYLFSTALVIFFSFFLARHYFPISPYNDRSYMMP